MFFIKSALEALEMPGRPFLHDVNHQLPVTGEPAKPVRYAIESPSPRLRRNEDDVVEPDGIEPTTSCLQSTRSTN